MCFGLFAMAVTRTTNVHSIHRDDDEGKRRRFYLQILPYSCSTSAFQNTQARTTKHFIAAAVHSAPERPTLLCA